MKSPWPLLALCVLMGLAVASASNGGGAQRLGVTPQGGRISEQGGVEPADSYNEESASYVARFTGVYPRQDWREVNRTAGTLAWYKFYLTQGGPKFAWPRGQNLVMVCSDSAATVIAASEMFVVSPDATRQPTFLCRTAVAEEASNFFHHDDRTLVIYAGFPNAVTIRLSGKLRPWSMDDVAQLRVTEARMAGVP